MRIKECWWPPSDIVAFGNASPAHPLEHDRPQPVADISIHFAEGRRRETVPEVLVPALQSAVQVSDDVPHAVAAGPSRLGVDRQFQLLDALLARPPGAEPRWLDSIKGV